MITIHCRILLMDVIDVIDKMATIMVIVMMVEMIEEIEVIAETEEMIDIVMRGETREIMTEITGT